ncbi:protein SMAX1-LIKE 3-like [Diospyros lotus]|uniref:protein SMAX1-LIKE 3-like n=1 Tax=Diospyros lotus TaxID=55363 RepID=UPI00225228FB|nr:protein SMAX1-LIKE 3-like [Diospyros lotus]
MRAGGCTVQGLTPEAANVVKQAVNLARRRGHTQVTPLHVANALLAASAGLLRRACLQSHSHHPFQCKALELCFNVALNRIPACSSSPILISPPHPQNPSISNALVAAFKRAQAHQRRGSIDQNHQQPLLAVKIELEQLVISILDDPSVSRVMREAGFSSTQVKNNVEKAVSLEQSSRSHSSSAPRGPNQFKNDDVMSLLESMMNKRRKSIVVVGECLDTVEDVVKGLMNKVDRGEVPDAFRELKFISLPRFTLQNLSRKEVEEKLVELTCHVKSWVHKGVVLYLGELLRWTTENRAGSGDQERKYYCPVEHMIMELGRLVCGIGENARFWLMGIATFQTYLRCKNGHPSLETLWGLHPLIIPEGSLGLSLISGSHVESACRSKKTGNGGSDWLFSEGTKDKQLNCSAHECSNKLETEAPSLRTGICTSEATASDLPSWLQKYKDKESKTPNYYGEQESVPVRDLCGKHNPIGSSSLKLYSSQRTLAFSSESPSCSSFGFSFDHQYPNLMPTCQDWPLFKHKQYFGDHQFSNFGPVLNRNCDPKQACFSNPSSTTNSPASSDVMETELYVERFKEFNSKNSNILCSALEQKVPWQKDVIPEIASAILKCRSGVVKRKGSEAKEDTWLLFQGLDVNAKVKIARELARLIFGSRSSLVSMASSNFSSMQAHDHSADQDLRNKRSRDKQSCCYFERFAEAVTLNPHRVFLVEDVDQADYRSQIGIKRAIERGRITNPDGEEVSLCDAIVILSCQSFGSRSRACSFPPIQQSHNPDGAEDEKFSGIETNPSLSLDLNLSFDDDSSDKQSIDHVGLLESVDGLIIFKFQAL